MSKDNIIQFVGFTTELEPEEFNTRWKTYAKALVNATGDTMLQQEVEIKSRFKYVSKHEYKQQDSGFKFMKGKASEHFPDKKVKVVQAGGYTALQMGCRRHDKKADVKVISFIGHNETDINYYRSLSCHYLNIYQAYYENCTYAYIFEFFIPTREASAFIEGLKKRAGIEVAAYRECFEMQA